MPQLSIVGFNIVCSVLGGFIALFGLVSFLFKEKFYLSETLISLLAGVIFSPHAANLIRPLEYATGDEQILASITLYFSRLVLGIQLVIAGIQLPSRYLKTEWRSLAYLLGPGMAAMWVSSSLLVWALVPNLKFVYALAVGACVTPTDPVLANNIVKGKFADKNIPKELQHIVIAESGANDGLGYPFLFLPLYLIKYVLESGKGSQGNAGTAIGMWFYEIWVYQIILGTLYGVTVGWIAKRALHWAEERRYVDRESFLVFAVALALFITGTAGLIGTDDVLANFIAGNAFTWDDWFRKETMDDSLQPTIDMLLNVTFFIWIGATCPWPSFAHNSVIPIYRLVFLGILILLLRRPPFVMLIHKRLHQIEEFHQAMFVGFFGPIGVSALFYLYVALDYLRNNVTYEGKMRDDAERLSEILMVVIWFLVITSTLVHGLSIPLGKLGLYIPRTLSTALSVDNSVPTFQLRRSADSLSQSGLDLPESPHVPSPRPIWRIGRDAVRSLASGSAHTSRRTSRGPTPRPSSPTRKAATTAFTRGGGASPSGEGPLPVKDGPVERPSPEPRNTMTSRSIRFPDEESGTLESS